MNRFGLRIGPGAASIILVIVVVSMTILGVLALSEAGQESVLADKSADRFEESARLEHEEQLTIMQLDEIFCRAEKETDFLKYIKENLPQDVQMKEHLVSFEKSLGAKTLSVTLKILPPGESERFIYIERRLLSE